MNPAPDAAPAWPTLLRIAGGGQMVTADGKAGIIAREAHPALSERRVP